MDLNFDYGKALSYGRLAKALLRKAAGVEQRGHEFDLAKALESVGLADRNQEKALQDESSLQLIKERKKIAPFKLADLKALPDGSFGRAYADFMEETGRSPKFFEDTDLMDDTSYLALRMAQTQEMWQVLVGFDDSPSGRAGFSAFVLAQTGETLPALSIATHLLRAAVSSPAGTKQIMNEISRGWLMGLKAEPLFSIDWEAHWVTPISEMKRRYLHTKQMQAVEKIYKVEERDIREAEIAQMDA